MHEPILFLVGATHRTAPVGLRQKLALNAEAESAFAAELSKLSLLQEFVVLNTCNRVEIYGVANAGAIDRIVTAFCARQQVDQAEFGQSGFVLRGEEAIQHLLEVAAGLDSQILGETEIFGQVKRAYANAQNRGSVGPILNRLFQKAFQAAKQVRTRTAITVGQVSVANVAVDLATSIFGSVAEFRVLLLGAGEMGEKSAKAFAGRGVTKLTVASRQPERAQQLAEEIGASVIRFEERESRLAEWDIVVCATSAPQTVLSATAIRAAMKERPDRPMLLVDLAMPRDVEEAAAEASNVFLYNLDDLARISDKNRLARTTEAERGRKMLTVRADSLWRQIETQFRSASQGVDPARGPFGTAPHAESLVAFA